MDSSRVLVVLGCVDLDVGYVRFWYVFVVVQPFEVVAFTVI